MILPITLYGASVLQKKTEEVAPDYPDLQLLIENMRATMEKAEGVGLAAPQVGKPIRLFVVNGNALTEKYPEGKDFVHTFINAHIVEHAGTPWRYSEGCLSIPKIHEEVERPARVRVQYVDENFAPHDEWFEGIRARIIQHEYDHLEGKNFIDHLSPIRRQLLKSKLVRISKGVVDCDYNVKVQK
ncbi:peptide deformylase [Bacteroidia bacterium]|nr:peptide deformylase [Bacteroidia bacterium]